MKSLLLLAVLLSLPSILLAEEALPQADEKLFSCEGAKFLPASEFPLAISAIQKAYVQTPAFHAQFAQHSYLAALDVEEQSRGRLWYAKPGRMKWHYEEPEEKVFLLVNEQYTLLEYVDEQAIRGKVEGVFLSDLPVAFLLGLGDLAKSFEGKSLCVFPQGQEIITLVPRKNQEQENTTRDGIESFRFRVQKRGLLPEAVELIDSVRNSNRFFFQNLKPAEKLPLSIFQIEIPKGFDVLSNP